MRGHLSRPVRWTTLGPVLLAGCLVAACQAPRRSGGGGGDDDDAANDDDAAGGDCDGRPEIDEQEPNDDSDDEFHDLGTHSSPGFCVSGSITCGNDGEAFAGDEDWFEFRAGEDTQISYELRWPAAGTDVDAYIRALANPDEWLDSAEFEVGNSESGQFTVSQGNIIEVLVACWEGTGTTWQLEFAW